MADKDTTGLEGCGCLALIAFVYFISWFRLDTWGSIAMGAYCIFLALVDVSLLVELHKKHKLNLSLLFAFISIFILSISPILFIMALLGNCSRITTFCIIQIVIFCISTFYIFVSFRKELRSHFWKCSILHTLNTSLLMTLIIYSSVPNYIEVTKNGLSKPKQNVNVRFFSDLGKTLFINKTGKHLFIYQTTCEYYQEKYDVKCEIIPFPNNGVLIQGIDLEEFDGICCSVPDEIPNKMTCNYLIDANECNRLRREEILRNRSRYCECTHCHVRTVRQRIVHSRFTETVED